MKTAEFDYQLPAELIAQTPVEPRDASRLLVFDRTSGTISHHPFRDIDQFLRAGDIVVANNSRVRRARLLGHKEATGGQVEFLLLDRLGAGQWRALVGGKRLRVGSVVVLADRNGQPTDVKGTITAVLDGPLRTITFSEPIQPWLDALGHVPLPTYIGAELSDPERYQTVYAKPEGSAAAPTAGLHFTADRLLALRDRRVQFATTTLHVGLDTFKPVTAERVSDHTIHSEWAQVDADTARRINETKLAGGRLLAVGTTAVRTLETAAWRSAGESGSLRDASQQPAPAACPWQPVAAFEGPTDLFIYPGYHYRVVDALLTNFHLPRSSLLMLVAAFMGQAAMQRAYETAVAERYRFYSFGDAMLIL